MLPTRTDTSGRLGREQHVRPGACQNLGALCTQKPVLTLRGVPLQPDRLKFLFLRVERHIGDGRPW